MSDDGPIRVEKDANMAWVILDRPEKRNAMDIDFFMQMVDVFTELDEDPEVRVAIIKAEGKSFTAGIDLMSLASLVESTGADAREFLRHAIIKGQQSTTVLDKCRKPVIAAVHGHCIGGGIDLLCACDIRLASKDAVFSVRETRLGVVADLGTLQRLPDVVGDAWARELCLTGRDFTADDALRIGLITHLVDTRQALYDAAGGIAREIAENPPLAVMGVKDTMRFTRENGVQAGLEYVAQKNATQLICEDAMEAISAFMEKRKPVFKGK